MDRLKNITRLEWVALIIVVTCASLYVFVQTRASTIYSLKAYIDKHVNFLSITKLSTYNITQSNTFQEINNGDLAFFCGDTRGERTCRWCTGSIFSHISMLFREVHAETQENVVYVWEADVGQHSKRGPRVMKLIDKLKKYHGYPYFAVRKLKSLLGTYPSTENILKVVDEYKHFEFDDSMMNWWFSKTPFVYKTKKNGNKVFCSELIALTMKSPHINMMNDNGISAASYSPGEFAKDGVLLGLNSEYTYDNCEFIDFSDIRNDK